MALVVCPTPIGNLEDVTLRALEELGEADLVLCEDTRRTRTLLERHGIRAKLLSYHAHNEAQRVAELVPRLVDGERVVLASDAGLPALNDPGARLIRAAIQHGVEVVVLPGPSAIETALVASGLMGDRYTFLGYVPRREKERERLWEEISNWSWPAVAFESPRRLPATLASLAETDPDRPLAVCRELTKVHEEVVRGSAQELSARFAEAPRGEVTLVIGASAAKARGEARQATAAVAELVAAGLPRRRAVDVIARATGVPRNSLYRESL